MIGLLKMDPSQRLTGEQALMHEYFDDIREPDVVGEGDTAANMSILQNVVSA